MIIESNNNNNNLYSKIIAVIRSSNDELNYIIRMIDDDVDNG